MSRIAIRANEDRAQLGIFMMLLAYAVFSLIDTSVKWLVIAGIPAMQLAFMRYVGHFFLSLGIVAGGGLDLERFRTEQPFLVCLRAFFLISATALNFIALRYLPLTITSAIMFSAPIIVCALSGSVLGERVGLWRWGAISLGFLGVLIVIRPFGEGVDWVIILPVYNAFALACYSLITRKLSGQVAAETMQFYMGALGTFALLPFALWDWVTPSTPLGWVLMIALGIWGWGGHELMTRAHGFAPAHTLMPFTYSFMIYLTITSYLIFDHIPDGCTLLGAAVIVLAGLIIWMRERVQAHPV